MTGRSIRIPQLLHVGRGSLATLPELLAGEDFALDHVGVGVGAGRTRDLAGPALEAFARAGVRIQLIPGLDGRLEQAAAAAAPIIEGGVSLMVAIGGGRVIDTVKLAAARTGVDFVSVPTSIANDGISSPVASLADRAGRRASHAAAMPAGVVVDVDVIGSAPPETLRAGAADLLSNLTALLDWRLAAAERGERFDAFAAMIAESAAHSILDLADLEHAQSHEALAKGLVLSGLAMAAAGTSRPCSGAEHLVSHSLDELLGPRAALHGEQVALGSLIAATAHESELADLLRGVFERLSVTMDPLALGIDEQTIIEAVARGPQTRPDRFTILTRYANDREAATVLVRRALARPAARA